MGSDARGWWNPQNWGLFGAAAWFASVLIVATLLGRVASAAGLPDGVRVLAGFVEVVIVAMGIVVLVRFYTAWGQMKRREKE